MARLLINNTEQRQPEHNDETEIVLYGREAQNPAARVEVVVTGFEPYLYAPEDEVESEEDFLLSLDTVQRIEYGDFEGLEGESLARIYTQYPQHVPQLKPYFEQTWAADVPFTNRFRIDTGLRAYVDIPDEAFTSETEARVEYEDIEPVEEAPDLEDVTPRIVTLDIEVDDRGEGFPEMGEERILSIVAHDSYTDETKAFLDTSGRSYEEVCDMLGVEDIPEDDALGALGLDDTLDSLKVEPSERRMLIAFRAWFNDIDPDIVTGWNADDFDIPFIIERMENIPGVSPNVLSPMGWSGETSRGEPRIKGRTIYDLLTVYKANSFTELDSYKLDDVAEEELGEEKIEFTGSYYSLYAEDTTKFLRYNAHDVVLAAGINDEADVIQFRDILRREVGVDFEDSYNNKDFLDMMCRRKLKEFGKVGPTRPEYGEEPDSDYEGAYVFDAYEGVAENVVGIDLASLYPYTMAMLNASPETKVGDDFDGPACRGANGQRFRLDRDSLFRSLVDDAISLKSDYKEKIQEAETPEERKKYERKYASAKTITNSIYGVTGWERFFLYDEAVAEAVTLTGQAVIKRTAEYIDNQGWDIIYGDTDSTYIKFPSNWTRAECLDEAQSLCNDLNNSVYPTLAASHDIDPEENMWEIEVEAYMERYFQAGKKKRYAYLATWKDGQELAEPDYSISGFSSKRSDSSALTSETEEEILHAILDGNTDAVSDIIFEAAQEIQPRDVDWDRIGIPGGMNKRITDNPEEAERDEYYAVSCEDGNCYPQDAHPRAVYNANKMLDVRITTQDKPKRVYLRPRTYAEMPRQINVIAFNDGSEIESSDIPFVVDTQRMLKTVLIDPLEEICGAITVDVQAAVRGQQQTGLGAFE